MAGVALWPVGEVYRRRGYPLEDQLVAAIGILQDSAAIGSLGEEQGFILFIRYGLIVVVGITGFGDAVTITTRHDDECNQQERAKDNDCGNSAHCHRKLRSRLSKW